MKLLKCECCGAPLNKEKLVCEYCGAKYKDEGYVAPVKIETFKSPCRVLKSRLEFGTEELRCLEPESFSEFAVNALSRNLADALKQYMEIETVYDPARMTQIVTAKCRVLEPDYRF